MAEQPEKQLPKLTKHDFYFETPLYEAIYESQLAPSMFSGELDAYSAKNKFETTYKVTEMRLGSASWEYLHQYMLIRLTCKRKNNDILCFFVLEDEIDKKKVYVKLGQWPSLADIQFAELGKKYDKYLSREDLKEFKRAIGLAAHGVGAGSFVYLRRIFENLIAQTFTDNLTGLTVTPEEFRLQRMDEKVTTLKAFLPTQLVAMKAIYSILSKGVHELSEEDCLKYFGAMKLSIELILDQKIELDIKAEHDRVVKAEIAEIGKALNSVQPQPIAEVTSQQQISN